MDFHHLVLIISLLFLKRRWGTFCFSRQLGQKYNQQVCETLWIISSSKGDTYIMTCDGYKWRKSNLTSSQLLCGRGKKTNEVTVLPTRETKFFVVFLTAKNKIVGILINTHVNNEFYFFKWLFNEIGWWMKCWLVTIC